MEYNLTDLLEYLDRETPAAIHIWQGWQIAPIQGGMNNRLYRASAGGMDLAVKWTLRDARDRAGREFAALHLLEACGTDLAPRAIMRDRETYRLPVVVQTWLDGAVLTGPPETDSDWQALIAHFRAIHAITPQSCDLPLSDAVTSATSSAEGKALIADHAALLPIAARPPALQRLLERCAAWEPPTWPTPQPALCRVDPSWHNLIRRPQGWASVDWENSGWSDPAFEIANLITHPAYAAVSAERWAWVITAYAQPAAGDLRTRIGTYVVLLRIWWAIRWARTLYEVPRGADPRLVPRDPGWQAHAEAMLAQALAQAEQAFDTMFRSPGFSSERAGSEME